MSIRLLWCWGRHQGRTYGTGWAGKDSALNRHQSLASNGPAFFLSVNFHGFKTSGGGAADRQMPQKSRASPPLFKHLNQQTIRAVSIKQVDGHHRQIDLLPDPHSNQFLW